MGDSFLNNITQGEGDDYEVPDEEEAGAAKVPLEVDVVLRNVFNYLGLEDLKSCRLVNSYWNALTIPFIKQHCGIISFNKDNYWTSIKNHNISEMSQFVKIINSSPHFPFVKIDIGTSVVQEPAHEAIAASLLKSISPIVTELYYRDEWGQELFRHGKPEQIKNLTFPCLQSLTIHLLQPEDNPDIITGNFRFIQQILKNAPSLDKIYLIDHNASDGRSVSLFIDALEAASCKSFSFLDIAAQLENPHLIRLSEIGLKLNTLRLDFWGSIIDPINFTKFLESQSSTLENLKIADCAMSSLFEVDFPRLEKLKSLRIKGSVLGRICISFPNISYARQFPTLKRLSFSTVMDEWDEFLKFGIQPVETVRELKLPSDFTDEEGLHHAARIFPNIRKLEISALLKIVNTVYDLMPNIEELILNTKYVDLVDDIITGLCSSECEEIMTFSEDMFQRLEREHLMVATTKPISSLKRLKTLRLKCRRRSDPVELTDVSCRLVLMKMNTLECLDFCGRHPPEDRISPHVLQQMKEKFVVYC